ncbi:MAG: Tol-Pal system beta propeller repeat protein TolB [Desulfobacteraceae bacterium]|nr:MAG: Tol-Pal system beta propeller repeat protein TolB [Desulfobacteraceae bacterium]
MAFGAAAAVLFTASAHSRQYDYVDISNPFLKKIPLAIPAVQPAGSSPAEAEACRQVTEALAKSLDFTGYFKLLDREAFLIDPNSDWTKAGLNFRNWTAIGAELLTTGKISVQENLLEVELRLYDTFKEQMIVGKRYKGFLDDKRRIVHRFCSEVIFALTGDRGLFESQIAFESKNSGNKEIFTCAFDGYSPVSFTSNKSINLTPSWSSDGQWLAYTSYAQGKADLFIRNIKEKRGTVVDKKGINTTPAWVPGQFTLAATLSFEGDPEIYLLTGAGKIIKRLTNSYGIDVSPNWSPDGKKMAFVSNRSGSPQIYIKDMESGKEERLTYEGQYNTSPAWSPKGDRIAYTGMHDGIFDIFVIRADGSGLFQLTDKSGDNESPSWSPDGSLLAFSSTREGSSRIYVMTAFGTDQRRLVTLPGEQSNPEWSKGAANP